MIDIHNHLLYGVDDGAQSIEESIDILKDLYDCGFTDVILTPHYIKDTKYSSNRINNYYRLKELRKSLEDNNINIKLYLGNEIYIDEDIYKLLANGTISTLNNTRYTLVELPISGKYDGYKDIFQELINKGCNVILAHPERYMSFQQDFSIIYELEKMGVYFQSNLDSIIGGYGDRAQKMMERLLKEKKVSFLATDIHHKKHDYNKWLKAKAKALEYISEEEFNILVNDNPKALID